MNDPIIAAAVALASDRDEARKRLSEAGARLEEMARIVRAMEEALYNEEAAEGHAPAGRPSPPQPAATALPGRGEAERPAKKKRPKPPGRTPSPEVARMRQDICLMLYAEGRGMTPREVGDRCGFYPSQLPKVLGGGSPHFEMADGRVRLTPEGLTLGERLERESRGDNATVVSNVKAVTRGQAGDSFNLGQVGYNGSGGDDDEVG